MTSTAVAREIERYVAKTPKSRALQAEAEQVLPGGSSRGTAYFAPVSLLSRITATATTSTTSTATATSTSC